MITAILAFKRWWPLAATLLAFGAGWTVNGWRLEAKHASELQEQINARAAQERVAQKVSAALEEKLATIQKSNRELSKRLAHETANPAYACRVPSSGVLLLNDAVSGNASRQPDGPVPGSFAAGK